MEYILEIINCVHDHETRGSRRPAWDKKLENPITDLVDDEFDDWLFVGNRFETVTAQAKMNIASVRLVCKKLQAGSINSFLWILNHRCF